MLRLTLAETVLTGEAGGGGDDAGGGEDCLLGGEVMDGLVAEGVGLDWVGGSGKSVLRGGPECTVSWLG